MQNRIKTQQTQRQDKTKPLKKGRDRDGDGEKKRQSGQVRENVKTDINVSIRRWNGSSTHKNQILSLVEIFFPKMK